MHSVINVRTFEKILVKGCSNMGEMPSTVFNFKSCKMVHLFPKVAKCCKNGKSCKMLHLYLFPGVPYASKMSDLHVSHKILFVEKRCKSCKNLP